VENWPDPDAGARYPSIPIHNGTYTTLTLTLNIMLSFANPTIPNGNREQLTLLMLLLSTVVSKSTNLDCRITLGYTNTNR